MSLKLGTQDISGISQNTKYNAHHLLDFKWTDCIMNDVSWLRADTFSWQSGDVYTSAYNHLVADLQGTTAETETIGSYTVTFYRATDGHKICLADQETTVLNIYNESGIAWYYIVDTTNTQFKLPRTKYGFEGLRNNVGDMIPQDVLLPNITGSVGNTTWNTSGRVGGSSTSALYWNTTNPGSYSPVGSGGGCYVDFDASRSSSVYSGDGTDTNIQQKATQMYLYFYVGDYSQTAIEQTAGLNSELFNGKVDLNLDNMNPSQTAKNTIISWGMPDWSATVEITSSFPYTCPSDGYLYLRCYNGYNEINSNLNTSTYGYRIVGTSQASNTGMFPVQLNEILTKNSSGGSCNMFFIPLKGAN